MDGFGVQKFFIVNSMELALYSGGLTSGLVLDSGWDHTEVGAVNEGSCIDSCFQSTPIGGKHVSEYLKDMILSRKKK